MATSASGERKAAEFTFNDQHRPVAFNAQRYYDRKGTSTLEHWHVEMDPTLPGVRWCFSSDKKCRALGSGRWKIEWLQLEVTSMTIRENRQPLIVYSFTGRLVSGRSPFARYAANDLHVVRRSREIHPVRSCAVFGHDRGGSRR